jgi:hypothetical protein
VKFGLETEITAVGDPSHSCVSSIREFMTLPYGKQPAKKWARATFTCWFPALSSEVFFFEP